MQSLLLLAELSPVLVLFTPTISFVQTLSQRTPPFASIFRSKWRALQWIQLLIISPQHLNFTFNFNAKFATREQRLIASRRAFTGSSWFVFFWPSRPFSLIMLHVVSSRTHCRDFCARLQAETHNTISSYPPHPFSNNKCVISFLNGCLQLANLRITHFNTRNNNDKDFSWIFPTNRFLYSYRLKFLLTRARHLYFILLRLFLFLFMFVFFFLLRLLPLALFRQRSAPLLDFE